MISYCRLDCSFPGAVFKTQRTALRNRSSIVAHTHTKSPTQNNWGLIQNTELHPVSHVPGAADVAELKGGQAL